jgi:hypothetical protein
MIYIAIPYSHPCPVIRFARFETANMIAAELMRSGEMVFSPISHSHPIAQYGLPKDYEFWEKFDDWFLSKCDKMIIVQFWGWEDSIGVKREIQKANMLGVKIEYRIP